MTTPIVSASSLGLISTTPLNKDEQKRVQSVLNAIYENNDSIEFRNPVDHQALGLLDYLQIVKRPIDLGTIKKNMQKQKYKFVEEVLNDIQLVWDNCKLYNQPGSWIYKQSEKLEKFMRRSIKNFLPNIQIQQKTKPGQPNAEDGTLGQLKGDLDQGDFDTQDEISYQEKLSLSTKVKHLTQDQLGQIVKMIQDNCPDAFKEVEKDKCQILVDNLNKDIFTDIIQTIESWLTNTGEVIQKKVKKN